MEFIIKNPVYIGLQEVNKANQNLPEEEITTLPESERYRQVPAVWDGIIDEETWERVQKLREENHRNRSNALAPVRHRYVLTGVIRCADCDTALEGATAVKKGQTYPYYRHPARTAQDGCRRAIRAEVIEEAVLHHLNRLAEDASLLEGLVDDANQRIIAQAPDQERVVALARRKVSELEEQHSRLIERLLNAPVEVPASFWAKANELELQLKQARGEAERQEREPIALRDQTLEAKAYAAALARFQAVYGHLNPNEQAELLAYLLNGVSISEEEVTIELVGQEPVVEEMSVKSQKGKGTATVCAVPNKAPPVGHTSNSLPHARRRIKG